MVACGLLEPLRELFDALLRRRALRALVACMEGASNLQERREGCALAAARQGHQPIDGVVALATELADDACKKARLGVRPRRG